jgi:acyl carrier protein
MENGSTATNTKLAHDRIISIVERLIKERPVRNCRAFRTDQNRPIGGNDKLVEIGLTSLDLARLVLNVEDEFNLRIPARDLTPANFRSISTVSQLISKLIEARS